MRVLAVGKVREMGMNVDAGGGRGSVEEVGRWHSVPAAAAA